MLWNEKTPVIMKADATGKETKIKLVSGTYEDQKALPCPRIHGRVILTMKWQFG